MYDCSRKNVLSLFNFLKLCVIIQNLDHVEHMESERTPKWLLNSELFGVHSSGRPRKRWLQDVKDGQRQMRTGKWKEKAQEQNTWWLIVKETKAHQRL
jgi:hypothetical protein